MSLYGANDQLLIQSDAANAASDSAQLDQSVQPGTYYLGVSSAVDFGNPSVNQGYVLATTFAQAVPPFQSLPVGNLPDAVAVGDFNHDGNLDIVTANSGSNTVSVSLGNGDGTFQNAVSYRVGNDPASVAVGDFNHDGNLDIVTANATPIAHFNPITNTTTYTYGPGTISVLLGNGDGTFQPAVSYTVGTDPVSVAVGDFNHDGNLDIVTADATPIANFNPITNTTTYTYGPGTVSVLLGHGDGTFQPAISYTVGADPVSVAVGEFTHDGDLDIVTANQADNTVSVLLGNGSGTFQPAVAYAVGGQPSAVAVGDFNADGNLDIVTTDMITADNTVAVLLGNGDGTFRPAVQYPLSGGPTAIAVGNINGSLDIVTTSTRDQTVSVFLGRGDGTFLPAAVYTVGAGPVGVALGDFNHDGNLDLVTANEADNTDSVLLGRGDGTFLSPPVYNVGTGPYTVAVGDFNGDGNLDVATVINAETNAVSVLLGNGDGTFQAPTTYDVGDSPIGVAVGQFTSDGNLDLVVTDSGHDNAYTELYNPGMVSVLLGRGDGTFLPAVNYPVGLGPFGVAVGDFNGYEDIVTANNADNTVSVLLGNGDGTFQPAVTYDVGSRPIGVAVGDFNGQLGIVTANSGLDFGGIPTGHPIVGISSVSVLLGNGNGTFQAAETYPVGFIPSPAGPVPYGIPYGVAVGDFNGHIGIVTANNNGNSVSVLLGDGKGHFAPAVDYPVGSNPVGVAVGDFNGQYGIVAANSAYVLATNTYGAGTVSVLLGNGNGTFQPVVSYPVGSGPFGVAVGDFTNDGNADIVTANLGDNTDSVLLGEGNGQFQTATPQNGIALRNIPYLQDLTGDGVPD